MSEAYVDAIINNALTTANSQVAAAQAASNQAITSSYGAALMGPPPITYTLSAVEPSVLTDENAVLTFEAQRDKTIALLSNQLSGYFASYYPLASDAFGVATNWLVNSITLGGTGIAASVEAQIWQRARDRVISDGLRAESQTRNEFAMRGFSIPPGAAAARLQQVRFEQLAKTQEESRDVAIKQAELTVENLRFAVEQAIRSRLAAMQAASEYIRAVMSGVQVAAEVASINSGAKARMMSATADLYRARLSRDEVAMRVPFANSDINVKSQTVNTEGFYRGVDARVAAAGHAAQVYGMSAQAALSSLSAIAGSNSSSFV